MGYSEHIRVERTEHEVVVESPYWRVRHDLDKGGCITAIHILNGSGENLLEAPAEFRIGDRNESECGDVALALREEPSFVEIEFRGRIPRGTEDAEYDWVHRYEYRPWGIRQVLRIEPVLRRARIRNFSPVLMRFADFAGHYTWGSAEYEKSRPRYMHIIGPHYDDTFGTVGRDQGTLQEDRMRPWAVALFRRGIEGVQWCGDSRAYRWNEVSESRSFRLRREGTSTALELCCVDSADPVELEGIELSWYLFLSNNRRLGRKRYYEVVAQTNPFPSDEMLSTWRSKGVDLIRIHNDTDSIGQSDDYWHDGRHPPFGESKMRSLGRFVRSVHDHGMRIVAYFSGWELSPDTELFHESGNDWYSPAKPGGKKRYTPSGFAGVYGCLMCPDSGWRGALEKNIRAALDDLGLDGFYLDWSGPGPCYNPNHSAGEHNGIDGLVEMLGRLREDYPGKLIVIHSGGQAMWLFHHNIADQYVTLEEGRKGPAYAPVKIDEYPITADYMGVGPASAVPNILYGEDRTALYRGLVHCLLLGALPYIYSYQSEGFGYSGWEEEVSDPHGIAAAMKVFSDYDWERYRFYSVSTAVAVCDDHRVGAAVYISDGEGVLLTGNLEPSASPRSVTTVELGRTPFGRSPVVIDTGPHQGREWKLTPFVFGEGRK